MGDTSRLIQQAAAGDHSARDQLLARHRERLTRMVALRMDPRVAPRFDPSDVVQEALVTADERLNEYLHDPQVAFYPWLRKITWERLVKFQGKHLQTQKRSVMREVRLSNELANESLDLIANQLVANMSTPSQLAVRKEIRHRIRAAIALLSPRDQEIIELLYVEQLKSAEAADVLEISTDSVRTRHLRALQRLMRMLSQNTD